MGRRERRQVTYAVDEAKNRGREAANQPVSAGRDGLEYRLHIRRRTGDDLQDFGGSGLPFQRLPGLVEQPRVLDGDHGLVGEALLKGEFFRGERQQPIAINDERAERLPFAPERGAAHRTGARRAGVGEAGPIGHRRIEMIEVRNVKLPVLADHRARHVSAADPDVRQWNGRSDTLRAVAKAVSLSPFAVLDELNRHAGRAEQTGAGFRDLLQRPPGIAWGTCNGAQDFGGGVLSLQCLPGLVEQPRVLDGDDRLVCEALQECELVDGERYRPVALNHKGTDCLPLAPKRRTDYYADAYRTGGPEAGPVGDCRINIV